MIRHLEIDWPDPAPFARRDGRPIRILAVSDMVDEAIAAPVNRANLEPVDLIVGCGDLEPDYLALLADAFSVRLVYVRGNHDRGLGWEAGRRRIPGALVSGRIEDVEGLPVAGLEWPGIDARRYGAPRTDLAWQQAVRLRLSVFVRTLVQLGRPVVPLVVSHVPPRGLGDVPSDAYHRGFRGYRWLMRHLALPLWLHGHTPTAATTDWRVVDDGTTVVNVTGAVLIELRPPG